MSLDFIGAKGATAQFQAKLWNRGTGGGSRFSQDGGGFLKRKLRILVTFFLDRPILFSELI